MFNFKEREVYWLFVNLQRAYDAVMRKVLWLKLGKRCIITFTEGFRTFIRIFWTAVKWRVSSVQEEFCSVGGLRNGCG
jgi:hypothetical protein